MNKKALAEIIFIIIFIIILLLIIVVVALFFFSTSTVSVSPAGQRLVLGLVGG